MREIVKTIQELGSQTNTQVFIVGGYIRDFLLNKKSLDLDIAVSKSAEAFAKKLADKLKGKFIVLDAKNKNYRIAVFNNLKLKYIDISLMLGKKIENDLQKRDFTINALAVSIDKFNNIKNNLIDCCGGYKDLKSKTINAVSKEIFSQDPLRMLRCFRLAGELNLKISTDTFLLIKKNADKIKKSAPERIKNELFRILNNKNSTNYVIQMDDCKLLENLFPIIASMKRSAKKFYYHPKGLFQHTIQTLESLEKILSKLGNYFKQSESKLLQHLNVNFSENVNKINLLKFISVFHDCAKPDCAKKVGKKLRFLEHEEVGAEKIAAIMQNLKMSKKEIEYAKDIVKNHMRPSNLLKTGSATERAKLRLFRDIGENIPDLLMLALADWHSYKSLKVYSKKILRMQEKYVSKFVDDYFESLNKTSKIKIIDGNILMKKLHLKPGKLIGELLRLITLKQAEGSINSQKEAILFSKSKLTALQKTYKI
ncbi:MAG: HD domain-containing protein [Endomicrobiaceae bacterium]|nr:HD domain-containing protein [Endomicrobiaceae bacterium]